MLYVEEDCIKEIKMPKKGTIFVGEQQVSPTTEARCVTMGTGRTVEYEMGNKLENAFSYINVGNMALIQARGGATLILKPRGSISFRVEEGEFNNVLEIWGEDSTYEVMMGATQEQPGAIGLVPAPNKEDVYKCLFGDGEFHNPVPLISIEDLTDEESFVLILEFENGQAQMITIPYANCEKTGVMSKNQAEKLDNLPTKNEMDELYASKNTPIKSNILFDGEMNTPGNYDLEESVLSYSMVEIVGVTGNEPWSEKIISLNHLSQAFVIHGMSFGNGFASGPQLNLTGNSEGSTVTRIIGCK